MTGDFSAGISATVIFSTGIISTGHSATGVFSAGGSTRTPPHNLVDQEVWAFWIVLLPGGDRWR